MQFIFPDTIRQPIVDWMNENRIEREFQSNEKGIVVLNIEHEQDILHFKMRWTDEIAEAIATQNAISAGLSAAITTTMNAISTSMSQLFTSWDEFDTEIDKLFAPPTVGDDPQ